MPAYAIGNLRPAQTLHDEVLTYIERVQGTLDPFGGRFLVHGAPEREVLEGEWPQSPVIIVFPSLDHARRWYASEDYQALLPLRTRHMEGDVLLIDGVPDGYDPAKTAAAIRAAQSPES
ncbi:DUF1330 domain-containing protein [Streptomyces thermolilacinus]|uniref:DUF1330 domain-containing protein n=1 Tax=Streptomyces thermolilacinus SPC6 TaxID=1306406 RepID=A0A1D3DQP7_9ACTN|nr:DUF1330 domain-containing protein [Streptomyces thermolilacinus]OEJ94648.1 hypothetical protein J116_009360 [Streptomyces thermolilacinus SPC6]